MLDLETAQKQVLEICERLTPQAYPLADALGCVLAEKQIAQFEVPHFDNTAMDGFALRAEDTKNPPTTLKIAGTILAGDKPTSLPSVNSSKMSNNLKSNSKIDKLKNGATENDSIKHATTNYAMKIMTGAPIPKGADAIIEVEKTKEDETGFVEIAEEVKEGNYIRRAGENISKGQVIISKGKILTPAMLGVLASQSIYEVSVFPKCRVGVVSTGSELMEGSKNLPAGKIFDSNRHILLSLIEKAGMEPVDLGIINDKESAILKAVEKASKFCNALITSGGVSMGDFDFVKKVLTQNKGSAIQVAIKPSKPLAFGRFDNMVIFGLPGNPVSALVSFELFARPGLRKMSGFKMLERPRFDAVAAADFKREPDGKTHFARVKWKWKNGTYKVKPVEMQGSHQLQGLAEANGLAIIEDGNGVTTGEAIKLICLD